MLNTTGGFPSHPGQCRICLVATRRRYAERTLGYEGRVITPLAIELFLDQQRAAEA